MQTEAVADYNDGLANENPSWSYDAAGNRDDVAAVDNLNRATTIGGVSRTYDILGNTLTMLHLTSQIRFFRAIKPVAINSDS